jgi:hypothetical protein
LGVVALILAALGALAASGVASAHPDGVEGRALGFDLVSNTGAETDAAYPGPGAAGMAARVIVGTEELAEYWEYPSDRTGIRGVKDLGMGNSPHIPEDATAILTAPGSYTNTEYFRVTGVYDDMGEWTVAVARRTNLFSALSLFSLNWGSRASGVLLVHAPPPRNVQIRVEDQTGGPRDGRVLWGGPRPQEEPD